MATLGIISLVGGAVLLGVFLIFCWLFAAAIVRSAKADAFRGRG